MSGKIEIVREGEIDFTKPIHRALLRDSRLSFGARGLFAFLWDLPKGWSPCLEHLVKMTPEGRDAIRARLGELQRVGAVRIEAKREDENGNTLPRGQISGRRWVLASPTRWAIEAPLSAKGKIQLSGNPIVGESPPKVLLDSRVLLKEAAPPRAPARGTTGAAASLSIGKCRTCRPSGIVTWLPDDIAAAEAIEQQHTPDDIAAAVVALCAARKQPVPGLIQQKIEQLRRAQGADERLAHEHAVQRERDKLGIDPIAQVSGEQFLSSHLRAKGEKARRQLSDNSTA